MKVKMTFVAEAAGKNSSALTKIFGKKNGPLLFSATEKLKKVMRENFAVPSDVIQVMRVLATDYAHIKMPQVKLTDKVVESYVALADSYYLVAFPPKLAGLKSFKSALAPAEAKSSTWKDIQSTVADALGVSVKKCKLQRAESSDYATAVKWTFETETELGEKVTYSVFIEYYHADGKWQLMMDVDYEADTHKTMANFDKKKVTAYIQAWVAKHKIVVR
jgi:hypothetical protein